MDSGDPSENQNKEYLGLFTNVKHCWNNPYSWSYRLYKPGLGLKYSGQILYTQLISPSQARSFKMSWV